MMDDFEQNELKQLKKDTDKYLSKEKQLVKDILFYLAVIIGCLLFIRFVAIQSDVIGSSMHPTFEDGDRLILDRISFNFRDPERFEVIVFEPTNYPKEHFIKRVIGLPGETVQVIDGYFYINGEKLEGDIYGNEVMEYGLRADEPVTLGPDEYFCVGDNRNHSNDSRSVQVGNVSKKQILGRVLVRFWPFSSFQFF